MGGERGASISRNKEELTPKDLETIKKLASLETSEGWKKLKIAVYIRYLQKIAEDKNIMKMFKEKLEYEDGYLPNINKAFTKAEEKEILLNFLDKKQKAFNEVTKSKKSREVKLEIADSGTFKSLSGEDEKDYSKKAKGLYLPKEKKVKLGDLEETVNKIVNLEHEMTHHYQTILKDNIKFSKLINLQEDSKNFRYDKENLIPYNLEYYLASLSERDAVESEWRIIKGIIDLEQRVITPEKEVNKDTLGYVAISQPSSFLPRSEDPFTVTNKVAAEAKNELEFSKEKKKDIEKILNKEEKIEFEKIIGKVEDFERLSSEFGENMQRNILDSLGEQLNQLKVKNKKLDLYIYEKKPPLSRDSYQILKRKLNPNFERKLPKIPKEKESEQEKKKTIETSKKLKEDSESKEKFEETKAKETLLKNSEEEKKLSSLVEESFLTEEISQTTKFKIKDDGGKVSSKDEKNLSEEEKSKKLELITKLKEMETSDYFNRLKKASEIRYTQKIAEDKKILTVLRETLKNKETSVKEDIDGALKNFLGSKAEEENFFKDLKTKKEISLSEAYKKIPIPTNNLKFIDTGRTEEGDLRVGFLEDKTIFISKDSPISEKIETLDHELAHVLQVNIIKNERSAKEQGLEEDLEKFRFSEKNYKNENLENRMTNLLERDAEANENSTVMALLGIKEKLILPKVELDRESQGLIAISNPKNLLLTDDKNPFILPEKKITIFRSDIEIMENHENFLKTSLNIGEKKLFDEILGNYRKLSNAEAKIQKIFFKSLFDLLTTLKKENPIFANKLNDILTEKALLRYKREQPYENVIPGGLGTLFYENYRDYENIDTSTKFFLEETSLQLVDDLENIYEPVDFQNNKKNEREKVEDENSKEDLKYSKDSEKFKVSEEEKPLEKQKILGEMQTTEKWKNLKKAVDIRYIQKISEDERALKFLRDNFEGNKLETDTESEINKILTDKESSEEFFKNLLAKKQESFAEASRIEFKKEAKLFVASIDEIKKVFPEAKTLSGLSTKGEVYVLKDLTPIEKIRTVDHEIQHIFQEEALENEEKLKRNGLSEDMDKLAYSTLNYKVNDDDESRNKNLLERDAIESEKSTETALKQIGKTILVSKGEVDREKQGLIAIEKPNGDLLSGSENPFILSENKIILLEKEMEIMNENLQELKKLIEDESEANMFEAVIKYYSELKLENLEENQKISLKPIKEQILKPIKEQMDEIKKNNILFRNIVIRKLRNKLFEENKGKFIYVIKKPIRKHIEKNKNVIQKEEVETKEELVLKKPPRKKIINFKDKDTKINLKKQNLLIEKKIQEIPEGIVSRLKNKEIKEKSFIKKEIREIPEGILSNLKDKFDKLAKNGSTEKVKVLNKAKINGETGSSSSESESESLSLRGEAGEETTLATAGNIEKSSSLLDLVGLVGYVSSSDSSTLSTSLTTSPSLSISGVPRQIKSIDEERKGFIEKLKTTELSEKWQKLKLASNIRYTQKLSEDRKFVKVLKKRLKNKDLSKGLSEEIKNIFSKKEEAELIKKLGSKKEEAFFEAARIKNSEKTKIDVVDFKHLNSDYDSSDPDMMLLEGLFDDNKNKIYVTNPHDLKKKLEILDHEVGHKYQVELRKNEDRFKELGLGEDVEKFKFSDENYDKSDLENYSANLLERDAQENEQDTEKALNSLGKNLIIPGVKKPNRKIQGLIGIERPETSILVGDKNPFRLSRAKYLEAHADMEKISVGKEFMRSLLSEKDIAEFDKILLNFEEFKIVESLVSNGHEVLFKPINDRLEELKSRNSKFAAYIENKQFIHPRFFGFIKKERPYDKVNDVIGLVVTEAPLVENDYETSFDFTNTSSTFFGTKDKVYDSENEVSDGESEFSRDKDDYGSSNDENSSSDESLFSFDEEVIKERTISRIKNNLDYFDAENTVNNLKNKNFEENKLTIQQQSIISNSIQRNLILRERKALEESDSGEYEQIQDTEEIDNSRINVLGESDSGEYEQIQDMEEIDNSRINVLGESDSGEYEQIKDSEDSISLKIDNTENLESELDASKKKENKNLIEKFLSEEVKEKLLAKIDVLATLGSENGALNYQDAKELTPKDLETIKKMASLETTEGWKKLKMAVYIRYLQKIAEDENIMKMFEERLKYKDGIISNFDLAFNKEEEKEILLNLIEKKKEAFNEATKFIKNENVRLVIVDSENLGEFLDTNFENYRPTIEGLYFPQEKKIEIDSSIKMVNKIVSLEHEMTHHYQSLIIFDAKFAELVNLKKDFENFYYSKKNMIPNSIPYYFASLLERDASESEWRIITGISDLTKRIIVPKKEVNKDTLGYAAISQPDSFLPRSEDPFTVTNKVAAEAKNELEFSKETKEDISKVLNEEEKIEFDKILEKFEDFERLSLELGESMQRNMLDTLGEQLNQLKAKNKKLDLFIYENKPPLTKESYQIPKRKANPNIGRDLPIILKELEEEPEIEETRL